MVIIPHSIPNALSNTLANGAKQFVVQEALLMTCMFGLYSLRLTPTTIVFASFDGAEMTTLRAPWEEETCFEAPSTVVNLPVASIMYSAPADFLCEREEASG